MVRKQVGKRGPVVLLAVLLAASALAGGASAAPPAQPPGQAKQGAPTLGYTLEVLDAGGNVVSRVEGTGTVDGADRAGAPAAVEPLLTTAASGCARVDAWVTSTTFLGFVAYRFHQVKHWCWSYPHITSVNVGTYFSDVDPNYYVRGVWGHGWYYTWRGSSRGGHYSYRQARVENCILHYGCIRNEYPWVEIWVNGNGAWAYNGGI